MRSVLPTQRGKWQNAGTMGGMTVSTKHVDRDDEEGNLFHDESQIILLFLAGKIEIQVEIYSLCYV